MGLQESAPQKTATAMFRGIEGILKGLRFTEGGQWERRSDPYQPDQMLLPQDIRE